MLLIQRLSTLAITAIFCLALGGCEQTIDTTELSTDEQFAAVEQHYPAVAEYLTETRSFFEEEANLQPLDGHIPGFVIDSPEVASRLRAGIEFNECVRGPSGQCVRIECDFDTDCNQVCSGELEIRRAICLAVCRRQVQRSCRVVLY